MKSRLTRFVPFLVAASIGLSPLVASAHAPSKPEPRRRVDLVLALDTSNSMDGLINSAKARLWDVVQELARAKPAPELRVALYTYGNDGYAAASGWVRKESDFTTNLDSLYQRLSAVTTNGGTEYVARVVKAATEELAWSPEKNTLRILYVAGNEAATQDPKNDVNAVAKAAITRGILVNTIYCGSPMNPESQAWAAVAKAADGSFAAIDQDRGVQIASTPMDAKLSSLSQELNRTYIGFGKVSESRVREQAAADSSAAAMGAPVAAARAAAKASVVYDNAEWDLVDASKRSGFKLDEVEAEALPAEMKSMSKEERATYVDGMAKKRESIQKEIARLSAEREKFLLEESKKQASKGPQSLDAALKASIRDQATKAGFRFD